MINPLLIIIAVVVGIVLIDALRHKVLFKIGLRNIFRRKTNTIIVILGLMIGTAIISSSFGVGDTMDNMVEGEIYEEWQETDVTIYNNTAQGNYQSMSLETFSDFKSDIESVKNVEGVSGEVHGSASVINPSSRLSEPNTKVIGMDLDSDEGFGPLYKDGDEIKTSLSSGEVYITEKLSENLEAEEGDTIKLFAQNYPRGNNYEVKEIIENKGRAAWDGSNKIIMSLEDAQDAFALSNKINYIRVTSVGGVKEGTKYSEQIADDIEQIIKSNPEYRNMEVRSNKKQSLEDFKEGISQFSDMFIIFGSFAIVAGIILTINIFVMLGEERKSEMGMSRAIGMKRSHLRRVFSYEGLFYSLGSSFIGALVGVGLTYIIFYFMEDIFAIFGGDMSLLSYFGIETSSLILAFAAGFLLTMVTVIFSVTRISKLNIVRAIREIPEPPVSKKSKKIFYASIAGLIIGGLMTFAGIQSNQMWLPVTGVSLLIIGIGTVIRRWVGDRIAYTGVGIFLLIWWMAPSSLLHFFEGYSSGLEMFILSGLFSVTAGVLVIMLNGSIITKGMEKMVGSAKGFKAVVLSAVSHPMKEKFRTGMTIFIFALIIFAITVMGMIVGIFDHNIDNMIAEQSGGYDVIGVGDVNRPIDNIHYEIENSHNISYNDFEHIDSAYRGMVPSNRTVEGANQRRSVIGIDRNFVRNSTFGISDHLDEYDSESEVWEAIMSDPSLVITQSQGSQYMGGMMQGVELGDTVTLMDKNNSPVQKKVIGFMDQFVINGLFMSKETVEEDFNITSNSLFFFDAKDNIDADDMGKDLEKEFVEYGFQPIVIGTIIKDSLNAQYMFFDLFSGYMGLGLIVGIAGLGIISLRAVHERRLEIGMMRAIGFKRRMISYAFLIENSFITITGIILGSVLGIGIGWVLWDDGFRPMGWEFAIPWSRIIVIALIAYFTMLITAIPSARKASKVSPAEALRFD
ncbi:MAG: FtsX-like permease family protein [Thermoplasmata archaeon]